MGNVRFLRAPSLPEPEIYAVTRSPRLALVAVRRFMPVTCHRESGMAAYPDSNEICQIRLGMRNSYVDGFA